MVEKFDGVKGVVVYKRNGGSMKKSNRCGFREEW